MRAGFSLVELSIVLVILGLLTGGILAGQSLIRAAELRAVTTEYQRWHTAMHTFRDKYMGFPGDFRDATRFWGRFANVGTCVSNSSAAVATPGTCDGNGDGTLQRPAGASMSGERFQFWRHLALAGLVEGSYSGYTGTGGDDDADAGDNAPGGKISTSAWHINTITAGDDATIYYNVPYGISLLYGAATTNGRPHNPLLRAEEAWGIDTKMDDGKPAYGKIIALRWNNQCSVNVTGALNNSNLDARYKLEDSSLQCALMFRQLM